MRFIDYLQSTTEIGQDQPLNVSFQWVFWGLIFFNLTVFAFVRTFYPGYISILFRTGIYNRQLYQNTQEDLRLNSAGSVFLTLTYITSVSLLLMSLLSAEPGWFIWAAILCAGAILLIKFLVIRIIGFLTETREGLTEHWINHLIYFQMLALILTPVLILTHFWEPESQESVTLGLLILFVLVLFVRDFQSFMRAIRQRISLVYIILYLCTLELIPLIVLIRLLVR